MPKAILILYHKEVLADGFIIETVVWRLAEPLHGCLCCGLIETDTMIRSSIIKREVSYGTKN